MPVFAQIAEAVANLLIAAQRRQVASAQTHPIRRRTLQAEERPDEVRAAGTDQAGDTEDFAAMEGETGHAETRGRGEVFNLEEDFSGWRSQSLWLRLRRLSACQSIARHHQGDQLVIR